VFKVIIKEERGDEVWIDFESNSEKWRFMKNHLPDVADFTMEFAKVLKIKSPLLLVKKVWLENLGDIEIINNKRK